MNSNKLNEVVYDDKLLETMILGIGKNIREERLRRDMSLVDLSKLTNIDRRQLYRIESGENKIGLLCLMKVMIALEIPVSMILPKNTRIIKVVKSGTHATHNYSKTVKI